MEKKGAILMHKYEVGRLLGKGTFAKVYHGRNVATGESVAIKVIDKEKVLRGGLIQQIKREISVMRLVRHPNIVRLHEVMASRTKIYFAMEHAGGGELFARVARGKLREDAARRYFQQLLSAVDFCHSRGVYHRDLKPENLLLDTRGNLKVSDFGLSALHDSRRRDGLLHTTCGTPAYVAPEVIGQRGYDGAKADVWSCGVVLFVLLAGFLPFHHPNLVQLYRKASRGEFRCPPWLCPEVRKLLPRILDPSPTSRICIAKLMDTSWFRKDFVSRNPTEDAADIDALAPGEVVKPPRFNAFDIISLSPGFDLSGLFEQDAERRPESRFTTTMPAAAIVSKFEQIAETEKFRVRKGDGAVKLEGGREGRKGQLGITAEIFEVTPAFHVVEVKKSAGDTLEYRRFCTQDLKPSLKDIVWTWHGDDEKNQ